ncbi:Zinc finger, RING/FYVE/PHD-type [Cynara cardunculus var. scolymus]|uniref:Zinc finger, RING/FYVE/PHD-type n=1 Tax=Cynara cardunculus var. scolymus TaxID=59895 RepID=A0A103XB16_CYNCS|nr:Zinc finger, RING/FYVE/PHD-type [Cynara cardunculus var. scolymus]
MSRSVYPHDHYLSYGVPDEIVENLEQFFPDNDGLSYEEVLLQQASMYQSFQERDMSNSVGTYDDGIQNWGRPVQDEGESSRHVGGLSQEAMDEALARSLQELEDGFEGVFISEHSGSASGGLRLYPICSLTLERRSIYKHVVITCCAGNTGSSIATPSRAEVASSDSGQNSIDPDNMQYEELVNLGESIGVENRGISGALLSRLPTSKYRSGLFSKLKKKEESCVICQMNYNSGDLLIMLPCSHRYHTKCITDWLMVKKLIHVGSNGNFLNFALRTALFVKRRWFKTLKK